MNKLYAQLSILSVFLAILISFVLSKQVEKEILAKRGEILYSFFSAGHTSGNPLNPQLGLYPPFVNHLPYINHNVKIELGFLTGDLVRKGTPKEWDAAQNDLKKLKKPIYIAAGNHDIGLEFEKRFEEYYYSLKHKNDLFIVLTPGLNEWNISGKQLNFLKKTLADNSASVNNIFILLHELIWWSPTNRYKNIKINYEPHYPGSTNFDTVIKPLLLSYDNNITLIAGDLGCTDLVTPFMYDQFNNITLIGSGMGNGKNDNIIITNVYQDTVVHNLIAINGKNIHSLGQLSDFSLENPEN